MNKLQVNPQLLQAFEQGFDPEHPERGQLPARVLGNGEISTVFEIQVDELRGLAFKRLPLFYSAQEVYRCLCLSQISSAAGPVRWTPVEAAVLSLRPASEPAGCAPLI